MNNKKNFLVLALTALLLAATAVPAFAGGDPEGWAEYCTQPGCDVSADHTVCSGHGSFGAFGKGWNLGIEYSPGNGNTQHALSGSWPGPGTNGTQTGINNSTLCGNPQN